MAETASPEATAPVEKFRKDYRPHPYAIDSIELSFTLEETETVVESSLRMRRTAAEDTPLVLDGEDLQTLVVEVDGVVIPESELRFEGDTLTLEGLPQEFRLRTVVRINPKANKQLSGLYLSNGNYCTQCEAEGFRRITWSLDRPDVMTTYRVRLEASRSSCPVLLSNGNCVEQGDLVDGRHYAIWEDPFPKPSYLFAVVAGDLGLLRDQFTTMSGREVDLRVYSEHHNVDRLEHAMESLKRSMRWDEEQFGLEYDLDIYNVVAVEDFNMGAMENKSLNVFNTAYVLARPDTATDADYANIEGVIGHEYFHNWTGNRVTCRDWFQLTLKEGLTVYRDQRFSSDMGSAAVQRIDAVRTLRGGQFPEDASPMAHPIRPESYLAMDNFYTATVYLKGAEVVRMYEVLLGREGFRKGMDLYFERHDGQAVTCDDFRAAMADANDVDLSQFERWYAQAGTPVVEVEEAFDANEGRYRLTFRQQTPATPGQEEKLPLHLPIAVGLLSSDGEELEATRVLECKEAEQSFEFEGLSAKPVASVLRGFSAPVQVQMPRNDAELATLFAHDTDPYCRWQAGQELATRAILDQVAAVAQGAEATLPETLRAAFSTFLADEDTDPALRALGLVLPSEAELANQLQEVDPIALHRTRSMMRQQLGAALVGQLRAQYDALASEEAYAFTPQECGRRSLRNACLAYLCASGSDEAAELAGRQAKEADNMTDRMAALGSLNDLEHPLRKLALRDFERDFNQDSLAMDKWFAMQAMASRASVLDEVRALQSHPAYIPDNPNKLRALLRSFSGNAMGFHRPDGLGHAFLADRVLEIDRFNPQMASRLVVPLSRWAKFAEPWASSMKEQLQCLSDSGRLSKDTFEIVSKSLA